MVNYDDITTLKWGYDTMELLAVRTIDELGRVVLPHEVRERLSWGANDVLAVSLNPEDGTVVLKLTEKHSEERCIHCGAAKQRL